MSPFIRRHSATCYFTLAFAISWLGIILVIDGGPLPASSGDSSRLFPLVYFAMLAGPTIAGLTLTSVDGGVNALRDYRARLLRWRVAPVWYAIAVLAAPLALALTMLVLAQFSPDFAPALLSGGAMDTAGPIQSQSARGLLLLGLGVGIGAGLFEELGWTGFAIPNLLKRRGVVTTGLMVGLLWGAWHFLAIWWGSASAFGSVPVALYLVVALFAFLAPYRILMVRVYDRTGSLLVAIVMHASLTASMIILGPPVKGVQLMIYDLGFGATLWMIVLLALLGERLTAYRSIASPALPGRE